MVRSKLEPSVGVPILVVGMKTDLSLSDVRRDAIPRFMEFGILVKRASLPKLIQQRKLTLVLDLLVNLLPITLLKMGIGYLCLVGNPLVEVSSGSSSLLH